MHSLRKLAAFTLSFASVVLVFFILIAWQNLMLPMVLGVVVWYLMITLAEAVRRLPMVGWRMPSIVAYFGAFSVIIILGYFIFGIIADNIARLIDVAPSYQDRLAGFVDYWFKVAGFKESPNFSELVERFDFVTLTTSIAALVRTVAENAGIILIYVVFLMLEQHSFDAKLAALIKDPDQLIKARGIVQTIGAQIQTYLRIKTLSSLLTAGLSYLVLLWVGVDFADFWALLIFLLNFIPTIGSIVATIFPCLLTLVQFETITPFILVTVSLITIQFIIGNIIEPRWMGRTFNLSGLVIIVSLAVWGQVWGIVGMFLCVPIMVITNIILANFKSTRPLAIFMSQDGQIK